MAKYRYLIVWQKANELALKIYKLTDDFPKKETFGITSQFRRAALSVPVNIERFGNALRGNGFQTADNIFRKAEQGNTRQELLIILMP